MASALRPLFPDNGHLEEHYHNCYMITKKQDLPFETYTNPVNTLQLETPHITIWLSCETENYC